MLYNYPLDVLTSEAPYLVIKAKDYKTLTQRASGSGGIQSHEYRLLLPTSISSSDNLSFEQQSILKGKALSDLIAGNGQDFAAGLVNVAQELVPDPFGVRENLSAATGKGFNPKEELLFKAPDLRTHAFTFNMFARNEQEAQEIANIIKNLRENAYPAVTATIDVGNSIANKSLNALSGGGNVFTFPKQFSVEMHPGTDNAFPRIDAAFLTSISTNYAGSGRVSLTPDDFFQGIELTLNFQDIRISTSEDINNNV